MQSDGKAFTSADWLRIADRKGYDKRGICEIVDSDGNGIIIASMELFRELQKARLDVKDLGVNDNGLPFIAKRYTRDGRKVPRKGRFFGFYRAGDTESRARVLAYVEDTLSALHDVDARVWQ